MDLLENLGVSDPTLEGAVRADGNVSIEGGNKIEIKNVTSFHDLEKAVHFELTRQQSLADRGIPVELETRQWDDRRKITVSARSKEEEQDYRYFLEGDIPWVLLDPKITEKLRKEMPDSIESLRRKYINSKIMPQVANIISTDSYLANKMNNCITEIKNQYSTEEQKFIESCITECANILTTDVIGLENTKEKRDNSKIKYQDLAKIVGKIEKGEITRSNSKKALQELDKTGKPLEEIISTLDLGHETDESALSDIIEQVIKEYANAVNEVKEKPETINFLVGKVMQKTKGKADPTLTLELLKKKLNS